MKKTAHQSKSFKTIKKFLKIFVIYFIIGLPVGYINILMTCNDPLYSCLTLKEYMSDPYLWSNTLMWPLLLLDTLFKL